MDRDKLDNLYVKLFFDTKKGKEKKDIHRNLRVPWHGDDSTYLQRHLLILPKSCVMSSIC